jgi:serine/threonine protein kinase
VDDGFVPILDAGEDEEGGFLVVPKLGGETLRERLARGPMPLEEALALLRELATALAEAHKRGYVHLGLEPECVFFVDGRPLIADLGVANHLVPAGPRSSPYAAPEQVRGARVVGFEADIHALGTICCECIFGLVPVAGERTRDLARRAGMPRLGWALELILDRARATDPEERFGNGSAVLIALDLREKLRPPVVALLLASPAALVFLAFASPRAVVFLLGLILVTQWCIYGTMAFIGLVKQANDQRRAHAG